MPSDPETPAFACSSDPEAAAAPPQQKWIKVDVAFPEGAAEGDNFEFTARTGFGRCTTFRAVAPASKDGSLLRKIVVTVPVPIDYPDYAPLCILRLTHNGKCVVGGPPASAATMMEHEAHRRAAAAATEARAAGEASEKAAALAEAAAVLHAR